MKKREKRARRSADDARRAILDAAERRLVAGGPSSLRLQDIAEDVGISHPAVLHHFGSREGLVSAVVQRSTQSLQEDLVAVLSAPGDDDGPPDGADLLERVFASFAEKGHARLAAWLVLSGHDPFDSEPVRTGYRSIVDATHALRLATVGGKKKPSLEDTRFTVALSSLALFGLALAGPSTFAMAGLGTDRATSRRFRVWLATLLTRHLAEGPSPPP